MKFHVTRCSSVESIMHVGLRPYRVKSGHDSKYPASVWLYGDKTRAVRSLSRGRTILSIDDEGLDFAAIEHLGGEIYRYGARIPPDLITNVVS